MTMHEKALDDALDAASAVFEGDLSKYEAWRDHLRDMMEAGITVYLSALLPEDAAGLVERLRNPADRYCTQSVREEAASLIQSQAAESAADKARIAELTDMVAALADALEVAREDVEHWGGYAGEYFREKHDLDGDLDRISKQAADARALLNRRAEG